MSNFPSLQPAMTVLVTLGESSSIDSASRRRPSTYVPMVDGSVKSEPGFSPAIDAVWVGQGADYIRNDASGKRMRLDARSVVKDKSGGLVYLSYSGVVDITPELELVLGGSPDAKTTDFGNSFIEMKFETGDKNLKDLEVGVFVGAGRFLVEKGKPVVVEYKISKACKGPPGESRL